MANETTPADACCSVCVEGASASAGAPDTMRASEARAKQRIEALARGIAHILVGDRWDTMVEHHREPYRHSARFALNVISASAPSTSANELGALQSRVAEVVKEYGGAWVPCSGCQESVDGYVSTRDYPRSEIFQCQPGGGCGECGGIGAIWDTTDWEGFAEWSLAEDKREAAAIATRDADIDQLRAKLALTMVALEITADLISAETPDGLTPTEADDARYRKAKPLFQALDMEIAGGDDRFDPIGWCFDWPADLNEHEKAARATLSDRGGAHG